MKMVRWVAWVAKNAACDAWEGKGAWALRAAKWAALGVVFVAGGLAGGASSSMARGDYGILAEAAGPRMRAKAQGCEAKADALNAALRSRPVAPLAQCRKDSKNGGEWLAWDQSVDEEPGRQWGKNGFADPRLAAFNGLGWVEARGRPSWRAWAEVAGFAPPTEASLPWLYPGFKGSVEWPRSLASPAPFSLAVQVVQGWVWFIFLALELALPLLQVAFVAVIGAVGSYDSARSRGAGALRARGVGVAGAVAILIAFWGGGELLYAARVSDYPPFDSMDASRQEAAQSEAAMRAPPTSLGSMRKPEGWVGEAASGRARAGQSAFRAGLGWMAAVFLCFYLCIGAAVLFFSGRYAKRLVQRAWAAWKSGTQKVADGEALPAAFLARAQARALRAASREGKAADQARRL
jgi:hypothetical protein